MTQLASPPSDIVSGVLQTLSVRSVIYCVSELRSPWGFEVEGEPVAKFHLVLEGSALLVSGSEERPLAAGDLVVLPRGTAHTLADAADSPAPRLERLLAERGADGGRVLVHGGGGPVTRLLCGGFSLAEGTPGSTLALLPETLHVTAAPWLAPVLAALTNEAADERLGAGAVVAKIADVFLAQALRTWLLQGEHVARAVLDDAIAKALHLLDSSPSEPWSLDRLARNVGLSRSALATKFRRSTGQSPMHYLTEVRLRRAAEQLAAGVLPVREIARRAGYASDAAFAKAFKRRFGSAPGAFRSNANEPPRVVIALRS